MDVPRFRIECRLTDSTTGVGIKQKKDKTKDADFKGAAKGLIFPDCLSLLTSEQQLALVQGLMHNLVYQIIGESD